MVREHHASIIPMMGADPCTHMGHVNDLGELLKSLPEPRIIGLSDKPKLFSTTEREEILRRQLNDDSIHIITAETVGRVIRYAKTLMGGEKPRTMHIVVGSDRFAFGNMIARSIIDAKHGLEPGDFEVVQIHRGKDRDFVLSGKNMRHAALTLDIKEFRRHIGPMFSDKEFNEILLRMYLGLKYNKLKIRRT